MKLINPTFTLQNLEGAHWLCSIEHITEGTGERISLTMLVAKDPSLSVAELFEVMVQKAKMDMDMISLRNMKTGQRPPLGPQ